MLQPDKQLPPTAPSGLAETRPSLLEPHRARARYSNKRNANRIHGKDRRKSFDTSDWPTNSRSTKRSLTKGDPYPRPNHFRPFLKARSAMQASNAVRMRPGNWLGVCRMD